MNIENLIENKNINITINVADLLDFAQTIATKTANSILEKHTEKVYTRNEVIEKFHICSATLWRWGKLGLIKSKKIGKRQYFSENEIKKIMENLENKREG